MKTDRQTGLKALAKYLRQKQDREILQRTYDQSVTDAILPRKQYPDLAGIKTVLDLIGDSKAAKAKPEPEQFVDMRFVSIARIRGESLRLHGACFGFCSVFGLGGIW
jgi:hypothetical protein